MKNERLSELANASVCVAWLVVKMYTPRYL